MYSIYIMFKHNDLMNMHHEMIATVSLVNIHHLIKIQKKKQKKKKNKETPFFLLMRTFSIYSLNNFQILIIFIMLYITSLVLTYFISRSWYLLTALIQFPLPHPLPLLITSLFLFPWVFFFLKCRWPMLLLVCVIVIPYFYTFWNDQNDSMLFNTVLYLMFFFKTTFAIIL